MVTPLSKSSFILCSDFALNEISPTDRTSSSISISGFTNEASENAIFDFIPELSFLNATSSKSLISAKSIISSYLSSINFLVYPSNAPRRYTFSLTVISSSKPAVSSKSGATTPFTFTFPAEAGIIFDKTFNIVDLPEPLEPIIPNNSPFFT